MTAIGNKTGFRLAAELRAEVETSLRPIILAVGEVEKWKRSGRALPQDSQIALAEFHDISPELLQTLNPDVVLSPLLCPAFDCLDLAQALTRSGFRGRYRIIAPALPNPAVIISEIEMLCPELDFSFIFTSDGMGRRLN